MYILWSVWEQKGPICFKQINKRIMCNVYGMMPEHVNNNFAFKRLCLSQTFITIAFLKEKTS